MPKKKPSAKTSDAVKQPRVKVQVVPYFRVGKRRMKVLDGATERSLDDPVHRSSYPDWDIGWDSSDYDDPNASESEFRGPKPDDDD